MSDLSLNPEQSESQHKSLSQSGSSNQPESSSWAASRKTESYRACIACSEDFPPLDLYQCPCSDEYCRECLTGLVHLSLRDETLFPPRCCRQPIPIITGSWFSRDLVLQLYAKQLEHETPNRTYCSVLTCSTFVPPAYIIGAIARCPTCSQLTCTNCKEEQHAGICRQNDTLKELRKLANENGWQICCVYHRIVKLDRGCYHISKSYVAAVLALPRPNSS